LQRLKTRSQFQAALAGGTVARTSHFALHRLLLPPGLSADSAANVETSVLEQFSLFAPHGVWMGAMVPKRWAKRAVTRNAIKRRIYTVSAEFETALSMAAHVVRLRAGFNKTEFVSATSDVLAKAVNQELRQLFARASAKPTAPILDTEVVK
jgi:ribonuclease P protein component